MRGGAQSHLMRADDGQFYVVKFQNNPQHRRVLANELLATRLAERIGLTVPETRVIDVSAWLVSNTPELTIQVASGNEPCRPGLNFATRFALDPFDGEVLDYLPMELLARVENVAEFAGMLCLDKWTCNSNGRQAIFLRRARKKKYQACFIDQGYCFNAGEWDFPDAPLRGVYSRNEVYAGIRSWDSFEPWLSRVEQMRESTIADCAEGMPPEWYGDPSDLERLLETLARRRGRVRELITAFRKSSREPFPLWRDAIA